MPKKLSIFISLLLLTSLIPSISYAKLDLDSFAKTPILDDGRIKPLDSFARAKMKEISGSDKNAIIWLTEILFDPARAEKRPIIKITNPEILNLLHLARHRTKLYSYQDVSTALTPHRKLLGKIIRSNEENWTPQQRDLIKLQDNLITMRDLLGSLSLILPLSFNIPEVQDPELQIFSNASISYNATRSSHEHLDTKVKKIYANKGDEIENYSEEEQALAHLSYTLSLLQETGEQSRLFRVIPKDEVWITPWNSPSASLDNWQKLAKAYHNNSPNEWKIAAHSILKDSLKRQQVREIPLILEYHYNQINPFFLSFILCATALSFMVTRIFIQNLSLKKATFYLLACSLLIQTSSLCARIYILDRAPVSTLYETILFVCLVVSLYCVSSHKKSDSLLWLWIGSALGVILHILGFAHAANGDTFVQLSAVLNTNFWLSTHVICVTAGYGFCALTSLLAHYTLVKMLIEKTTQPDTELMRQTQIGALFSLLFVGIGTVLGGIWADQSWGRFWGWDPKENGALLIVLWLIWIIHGKISGQMSAVHKLCGLSYLSVILALSWFGVNLLGVGLHSYGFTDNAIIQLTAFFILESSFAIACLILLNKGKKIA